MNGDSYSLKEALCRKLPIVVCELPYFKEIGIENNKNALFYNLDNSNAKDVAEKMKKPLKFNFEPIKDGYDKLLAKSKSHYEYDANRRFKVRATATYNRMGKIDGQLGFSPPPGYVWEVNEDRLENLLGDNNYRAIFAELIEEIK